MILSEDKCVLCMEPSKYKICCVQCNSWMPCHFYCYCNLQTRKGCVICQFQQMIFAAKVLVIQAIVSICIFMFSNLVNASSLTSFIYQCGAFMMSCFGGAILSTLFLGTETKMLYRRNNEVIGTDVKYTKTHIVIGSLVYLALTGFFFHNNPTFNLYLPLISGGVLTLLTLI